MPLPMLADHGLLGVVIQILANDQDHLSVVIAFRIWKRGIRGERGISVVLLPESSGTHRASTKCYIQRRGSCIAWSRDDTFRCPAPTRLQYPIDHRMRRLGYRSFCWGDENLPVVVPAHGLENLVPPKRERPNLGFVGACVACESK